MQKIRGVIKEKIFKLSKPTLPEDVATLLLLQLHNLTI